MTLVCFILLLIGQLATGLGLLFFLGIHLPRRLMLPLAQMLGLGVYALVPLLLQLCWVPLTVLNVSVALLLITIVCQQPWTKRKIQYRNILHRPKIRISLYEWPALIIIIFALAISAWRCFYFPPTPRDLTSGPEVIAHYAVRESTFINSVFDVNLETTNNQFKPPFITSLQLIYKLAGFYFGQVWLSILFFSFILFLYQALAAVTHRLIAGFLVLIFLAIPEVYAYSFMALFDLPNALYFTVACWFVVRYLENKSSKEIAAAGMFFGLATYIRSETLVLTLMMLPLFVWETFRRWESGRRLFAVSILTSVPSLLLYFLSVSLYIGIYLPARYEVGSLVNSDLLNLQPLLQRFADINLELLFHERGLDHYGYVILLFLIVAISDRVFSESRTSGSKNWGYAILVVYLGLPLLGFLLPLMDLFNSTKRALFKLFPLLLFYTAHTTLVQDLSATMGRWEEKGKKKRSAQAPEQ